MKIKHFAGYGTVTARKINDGQAKLHIKVEGNHEWGLRRDDEYDLFGWLIKRFDKEIPDYPTWHRMRPIIDIREDFRSDPKSPVGYVDIVDYYFYY